MQQEAELEELHSMQAWQQQLQEKLANLEEETMVTAEAILQEIEDARADVRNVTMKSLRDLTTKRRQELQQQHSSSPNGHGGFPKRPSPVFTPDDEYEDRAPSPASARTRRAVRKVRPDGPPDGATIQERRKWVEQMDTATLEAKMDDLMEDVHSLRKNIDTGLGGKSSPQRQGADLRKKTSPERDSRRRSPESRAGARAEVKSPPVAVLPQDQNYRSPARAKGSIIGELRRAGLSIGLPDQAKSAANSRAYDIAPPALRPGATNEQAEVRDHGGNKSSNAQERQRRSRSKSPHRRSEADEIAAAVAEEERRELEAAQQRAADKLYAEVNDALAEPWVEKGTGDANERGLRRRKSRRSEHDEDDSGNSVSSKSREQHRKKKPHGQLRSVSSRRDRNESGGGESDQHSPKQRSGERVTRLPSLASVSESVEEESDDDDGDMAEERQIKLALATGNVDEVRAMLAKSNGGGGGGQVLAKAGGGSAKLLQRQDSSGSHSGSDSALSPMQPADPEKMRQLQQEAITHKEYVEMSLRDTGWSKSNPEPSYMRPVDKKKKKKHMDPEYDVMHVQEVLSRSSKLRILRDQKAAAKRNRRAEAQEVAEQAALSYVRAATG